MKTNLKQKILTLLAGTALTLGSFHSPVIAGVGDGGNIGGRPTNPASFNFVQQWCRDFRGYLTNALTSHEAHLAHSNRAEANTALMDGLRSALAAGRSGTPTPTDPGYAGDLPVSLSYRVIDRTIKMIEAVEALYQAKIDRYADQESKDSVAKTRDEAISYLLTHQYHFILGKLANFDENVWLGRVYNQPGADTAVIRFDYAKLMQGQIEVLTNYFQQEVKPTEFSAPYYQPKFGYDYVLKLAELIAGYAIEDLTIGDQLLEKALACNIQTAQQFLVNISAHNSGSKKPYAGQDHFAFQAAMGILEQIHGELADGCGSGKPGKRPLQPGPVPRN
jgi:hypothetical protein